MSWLRLLYKFGHGPVLMKCSGILKHHGLCYSHPLLARINSANLSSWNNEIARKGPFKSETAVKGSGKKKEFVPRITLIGTDESVSIITFEEGEKIAKRRNLRLVKIIDFETKTQRPVYRLMTIQKYNEEHRKEKALRSDSKKKEKLITFSSRISDHDIQSKIKMVDKWLTKDYEIRMVVTGDSKDMNAAEEVYKKIEGHMKERARFLQKRQVNADIRFSVKSLPGDKSSASQEKKPTMPSADS